MIFKNKVLINGNFQKMSIPKSEKRYTGVSASRQFWDLKKTSLQEICVIGTERGSPTNANIPHLHIHKPKTVVVETV